MEEEKNGISLRDIFRIIFSQKWLALILAAAITLLCAVCIVYVYNPSKIDYSVSFKLDLLGRNGSAETYRYPDGTTFHYLSLVSLATLNEIKTEGGEEFANLDVDNMVKSGAISISEDVNTVSGIVDRTYTVKVKANYFANTDAARKFITSIAEYPCKYLSKINIEYNAAIKLYETSDDYARQIDYLNNQLSFLEQKYDSLISDYGNEFVVENGKTLKAYLAEIKAYGESSEFVNLKPKLLEGKHVKSNNCLNNYILEYKQVCKDVEDATFVLGEMTKGQSDALASAEAVRIQAEKVSSLKRKQSDLEHFVKKVGENIEPMDDVNLDGTFAADLKMVADKLSAFTDSLKNVTDKVYKNVSRVFYVYSNVVNTTGGMGMATTAVLSIVVGVLVAAVTAYAVGYNKNKKTLTVAANTENAVEEPAEKESAPETPDVDEVK